MTGKKSFDGCPQRRSLEGSTSAPLILKYGLATPNGLALVSASWTVEGDRAKPQLQDDEPTSSVVMRNDVLYGKAGADICDGGSGSDTAEQDGTDSMTGMETVKTIPVPQTVVGRYTGTLYGVDPQFPGFTTPVMFDFTVTSRSGSTITGYWYAVPTFPLSGTITSKSKFSMSRTSGVQFSISGTISGKSMSGYASFGVGGITPERGNFSATRVS